MEIKLAKFSGFCFGVKNAVDTAYRILEEYKEKDIPLYILGELTHNDIVVSDLLAKGFKLINMPEEATDNSLVLLRAHGVTTDVYDVLSRKNCKVIDCTCPFVSKIHKIVEKATKEGKNIIVTGTKGHPEVVGICSRAPEDKVYVISNVDEIDNIPFDIANSILVSQTTFSTEEYKKICENVKKYLNNDTVFDTICNTTESRQNEAVRLARDSDAMIVIGSKHSSNTRKLYDICKSRLAKTYLVSNSQDIEALVNNKEFVGVSRIGITAGASTPECIILEVVGKMEENDINFGDYIDSIPQLRKGTIVKGVVTSADADYVYVDVRDKSEGKIPVKELEKDPEFDIAKAVEERMEVTVAVKSIRNSDMGKEILLSKGQVDMEQHKAALEEAYNSKTPVSIKIISVVKDGVIGSFMGTIDVYVHRSQLKLAKVEAEQLNSFKGEVIDVIITKFETDPRNRLRVSGSHRQILATERKAKEQAIWDSIEEGKMYKGIVRSTPDFGAFVDIGGVDGLVHNTELSWNRIRKSSDVVSIGDEIDVYVISFDPATKKIQLGYKKIEDDPYYQIEERIPVGSIVKGKVVRIKDFGAFIQLEPNLDALCHVSQISTERLKTPRDVLSEGMMVEAKVIEIKKDDRRISVSIKEVNPINPEKTDDEDVYAISDVEEVAEVEAEAEAPAEAPAETTEE